MTGVHIFDLARHLTGSEFREIDSRQDNLINPVVEDILLARGRLENGCRTSLEVSKYTRSRACWLEVVGEDGQIRADYLEGDVILRRERREERFEVSAAAPTLPPLLEDWLASLRTGTPPPVTVADGLATLKVVDACYRSHAAKAEVTL